MGTLCKKRFLLKRDNISSRIRKNRSIGVIGCAATFSLFVLFAFTLSPLYLISPTTEATTKDPTPSSLTYTAIKSDAVLPLDITSASGSFATTYDHISFTLTTTNATGYTLNIKTSGNNTALVDETNNDSNTNSISSISSTITREVFSDANNTTYNNKWGIHPSSYYQDNTTHNNTNAATSNNPIYFPASNTGFTMDSTTTSNTEVNRYFVGLGVRADYTVPAGTYTNTTLIAEYVANPVTYAIHYYTNTTDTVTNMPTTNPQTGTVSSPTSSTGSIITTIASTPTRTGYTFLGWCMGSSAGTQNTTNNSTISNITNNATTKVDSCSSTVYDAGQSFGIDTTNTNPDTYYLYAMWSVNSYTCTKQYRLQNADGSWGNYTADGTEQIKYGETCNYSKTVTNYKNAANGTNNSTATTSGIMNNTNGITLSLDLYRNTFTCLIKYQLQNADGTYATAVNGTNSTLRYGETCSWSRSADATYKAASYSVASISANVNQTVSVDRNTFTVTKQYRLQNADGTYPTTYTSGGTETVRYGASTTYSIAATTSHQAASKSSGTVTANTTISLDVPRKTFTITKQYKLQGTDASYPSSYTADGTATVVYGGSYTYSRAATTSHQAASTSASNVTSNQTLSLDVPRKTFTCTKQYRLQNADGSFPDSYTADGTVTTVYGGSCSYSKTVTNYKGTSDGANGSAGSASASNVTANQTLSISFYRNTFTCKISYKYQAVDGTYGSATVAVNTTKRYGEACSWSTANISNFDSTTYKAANYTNNSITANVDTTVNIDRNTFTVTKRYRLQGTDGTYPTTYTSGGTETVRYGASTTYSIAATTTHQAASKSSGTVTAATTISLDVPRKVVTCNRQYRLENADGTWGSYTSDGTTSAYYGGSCSYSKTVTNYRGSSSAANGAAGSASASNVTSTQTLSISFYRNTFTCLIKYQLQKTDGTYDTAANGTNSTLRYGQTCSWSRNADTTYKAASYSVASITANVNQTVSVDRNTFTCSKRYRLQNADGTYPSSYTNATGETIRYGATCSYSQSATDYQTKSTSATVTAATTLSLDLPRNTYTLTVSKGTNIASVTGGGTYRWGQSVTVTATKSTNTTCITYGNPTWTASTGTAPSAGASTTYTMPKSNATVTAASAATNVSQTITLSRASGVSSIKIGNTNYTSASVSLTCGTYTISGNYDTNFYFLNWSRANGVTVASTTSASTTMTVFGAGTLTLNSKIYIQDFTLARCQSLANSANYTVYDRRDEKDYTVRYIGNQCWMTQNLRLTGGSSTLALSSTYSNVSSYTMPAEDFSKQMSAGFTSDQHVCSSDKSLGCWYNYYSATAGTISGADNTTNATSDICPKYWHLPSGPSTTSNRDVNKLIGNTTAGWQNLTTGFTAFGAVSGGHYTAGSTAPMATRYGNWWAATSRDSDYRYYFRYDSTNVKVQGDDYSLPTVGQYVRCVRTS